MSDGKTKNRHRLCVDSTFGPFIFVMTISEILKIVEDAEELAAWRPPISEQTIDHVSSSSPSG